MQAKEPLFGKTLDELQEIVRQEGLPRFTAKQITDWLYKKDITSIEEMTNLSKEARQKLSEKYDFGLTPHITVSKSADGTKKYLFPAGQGKFIESAYIPEKDRATLCVSSQVGCKMGCLFCATGKQGFQGQLSTNQILNQIRSLPEREMLSNIVFMGMGEPFDNLEDVLKSVNILTENWGFEMAPRRVTVSTIGIVPGIKKFLEETKAHLAVSLHSPFEEERKKIMPIENVYSLPQVMQAIRDTEWGRQRRVSFEYIMFKGYNDRERHVKGLVKLLHGIKCRINLLRFHPIPGTPLQSSDDQTIEWFRDALKQKGITTTIRTSRGQDIEAACGLLSTRELGKKESTKK
ncbi:MAG: 23S rRNA (adenine(2503)-C(2))-methyltransferase RlmN [Bacteroidales bacterium]|nr:23S rRNA (adenine(2503)-C(2))-methyltransferase RlmN [Bacteroidales bacterium]MCF8343934.1 23S rRNA (adenine(2503)-C(2))-methyltransferase RlmN [Bacteroidales bacterium]MCF8349933.1 23S rRNA (adenine(2503)-C(2))-methyltransferase RlmN [Bacteroidales bacterium]MCF8375450.1 23S rRNA (adenine(2503)-C(2))-methyltransferase RlmN [Bacteroidales bacterium]MCF8401346.1 23S rRNA (adenine(2503)-C(2))-methyltransferase RlmN [Bacteroidales bacterium]